MLFADDIAVIEGELTEEAYNRLEEYGTALEQKGLRINRNKSIILSSN